MEETKKIKIEDIPAGLLALPFVVGGGYFAYSRLYKKDSLETAGIIAALFFVIAALPALSYRKPDSSNTIAALPQNNASAVAPVSGSSHLNSMDSAGRKEAINYIVDQMEKADSISKYAAPGPPSRERRIAAHSTLTNDELKVLYCIYHFNADKSFLISKYGATSSDALAKKVAKEMYGIDLSKIDSIEKTAAVAITKVSAAL